MTEHPEGHQSWLNAPAFPAVIASIGCTPLLVMHFQQLWSRPHYQYFPLVLIAVAILNHLRRTDPARDSNVPRPWLAVLCLLGSMALAIVAVLKISPLIGCAAWILGVGAYSARSPINTWSQLALLGLLLRLPQGQDVALIQWLQGITSQVSSSVLDKLKLDHLQEGNILVFPDRQLFVEEACSGVVSLFTIIATAAIFGVFLRRSLFHTALLMLFGAFWAGTANVLRVVTMAMSIERMGIDLGEGWPHQAFGLLIFVLTLCVLFSSDGLLRFLFGPIDLDDTDALDAMTENPWIRYWNRLFWPSHERPAGLLKNQNTEIKPSGLVWTGMMVLVSAGFLGLGVMQLWGGIGPFTISLGTRPSVESLSKGSLPAEVRGWKLVEFRRESRNASSVFGASSRLWTYQRGSQILVVSIDYPFSEWHELDVCYRSVGWKIEDKQRLPDGGSAVQCALQKEFQSAWLVYDIFDQDGAPYTPPAGARIHPRWRRLLNEGGSRWTLPTYYQVQMLVNRPASAHNPPAFKSEMQGVFTEFRELIRQITISSPADQRPPGSLTP